MTLEGHTWPVTCVAELPDKRIISGSSDCTLKIWNLMCCDNTQRCEMTLNETSRVTSVAILLDGRIVVGTGENPRDDRGRQMPDNCTLKIWS